MFIHQTLYSTLEMVAFPCVLATVLVSVVIRNTETTKASDGLILQKQKKTLVLCQQPLIVELQMFQI